MSKITYIIKASEDVLNEKTASILVHIIKHNFITSGEVREALSEQFSAAVVNSNIGVLIKKGFIEKSGDGLVATGEAMDLVQKAADLFASENAPEMLEKRKTRSSRGVTPEMVTLADEVKALLEDRIEIREIAENRSNLEVRFAKRTNGIRQIEVRRDGMMRIFGYNMTDKEKQVFTSLNLDVKIKTGGKNTYIDFQNVSSEVIKTVTNAII
ncbi:activator of middle period transcription [Escherichia phage LHE83]|nr:MotA-like activator of middle period transcription [Salmonella phage vB_SalD_ABTNLS3]